MRQVINMATAIRWQGGDTVVVVVVVVMVTIAATAMAAAESNDGRRRWRVCRVRCGVWCGDRQGWAFHLNVVGRGLVLGG